MSSGNAADFADFADPNQNGIVNFLEYALGGDPAGGTTGAASFRSPASARRTASRSP